jgi:hypothetical protein
MHFLHSGTTSAFLLILLKHHKGISSTIALNMDTVKPAMIFLN